ncbi:MAG: hypothetical protein ACK5MV_08610 [Aminipila sp.]
MNININSLSGIGRSKYSKTNKNEQENSKGDIKENKSSQRLKDVSIEDRVRGSYDTYESNRLKRSNYDSVSFSNRLQIDKGTAKGTTVSINRNAYDKILSATTYGEPKWEEMGIDNEKRWVVINGQRFECELSPEEKAQRNKAQKTLIDYLFEKDEKKEKLKINGDNKPKGNIEALTNNGEVMNLLGRVFNTSDTDSILSKLA